MADSASAPKATWSWPSFATGVSGAGTSARQRTRPPGAFDDDDGNEHAWPRPGPAATDEPAPGPPPQPERRYGPRTCRICLEVVQPTYHMPPEHVPGFLATRRPRVTYESEDPELGRLLRPCKCRGSSRFVHEGCLDAWRKADPAMGSRNYWQCPTCKFSYRLRRVSLGRWLNSTLMQLALTLAILGLAMFLLGFVADPIISLYLGPVDAVVYGMEDMPLAPDEDGNVTWAEHFFKGLASLGLLGFFKSLLAMSPLSWWGGGRMPTIFGGGARHGSGRDRVANISWLVLVVGVGTFLVAVFKGVRGWSRRTLEMASEKVMDVPLDGDEDDEAADNTQ